MAQKNAESETKPRRTALTIAAKVPFKPKDKTHRRLAETNDPMVPPRPSAKGRPAGCGNRERKPVRTRSQMAQASMRRSGFWGSLWPISSMAQTVGTARRPSVPSPSRRIRASERVAPHGPNQFNAADPPEPVKLGSAGDQVAKARLNDMLTARTASPVPSSTRFRKNARSAAGTALSSVSTGPEKDIWLALHMRIRRTQPGSAARYVEKAILQQYKELMILRQDS